MRGNSGEARDRKKDDVCRNLFSGQPFRPVMSSDRRDTSKVVSKHPESGGFAAHSSLILFSACLLDSGAAVDRTPTSTTIKVNSFRVVHGKLFYLAGFAFFISCAQLSCAQPGAQQTAARQSNASSWVLTWSDEFNGANGSKPDPAKWSVETGGDGWGNNELQYYTGRRENVREEKGSLVIEAIKQKFVGPDGVRRDYTSGRLKTEGRFSQRYGRFEARVQIPYGKGIWPAFWMLGDDFGTAGWPACGEIDIMESVGNKLRTICGSMHGPGYSGANALTAALTDPTGEFSDGFHLYAIEWEPRVVRFFVDDHLYATRTPADLPTGKQWVFDHAFFVLLSLAVGGNLPGSPDDSTVFPQRMLVDYVRVYSRR